jgi:hypothetical protein
VLKPVALTLFFNWIQLVKPHLGDAYPLPPLLPPVGVRALALACAGGRLRSTELARDPVGVAAREEVREEGAAPDRAP